MAFELREGQGNLFKNDKDGNEKRPDYRGELKLLDGQTVKLAGWIKQGQKGSFMSLSIDKPREQSDSFRGGGGGVDNSRDEGFSGGGRGKAKVTYDLNDDIPFIRWKDGRRSLYNPALTS